MNQTLAKIERLGEIVAHNDSEDYVLDLTINKMLQREINKIKVRIKDFNHQLDQFEKKHKLDSNHFIKQYETGELGDDIDYIEWSATIEMKAKAMDYIANLQGL